MQHSHAGGFILLFPPSRLSFLGGVMLHVSVYSAARPGLCLRKVRPVDRTLFSKNTSILVYSNISHSLYIAKGGLGIWLDHAYRLRADIED